MPADVEAHAVYWQRPDTAAFTDAQCDEILAAAGPWRRSGDYKIAQLGESALEHTALKLRLLDHITGCAMGASQAGGWGIEYSGGVMMHLIRYREGDAIRRHYDRVAYHPILDTCQMAVTAGMSNPEDDEGGVLEVDVDGHSTTRRPRAAPSPPTPARADTR